MNILKKENWWIWLMLSFFSGGSSYLVLAALLGIYSKEAWYFKWTKKCPKFLVVVICILLVLTFFYSSISIMNLGADELDTTELGMITIPLAIIGLAYLGLGLAIVIFNIQILAQVNAKLKTPGNEIYLSPYVWVLCLIIPIIGWIMLVVMLLYLSFWYIVMLYRGQGEKYISVH